MQRKLPILAFIILALSITAFLTIIRHIEEEDISCDLDCEKYHYSNCPEGCISECMPSDCGYDAGSGMGICTDDCDGPGSCTCP